MSEWIHRIGLLVPSSDGVTEMDFKNLLPRNVSFHTARLYHSDSTPRGVPTLDIFVREIEPAIKTLVQIDPEAVVFACTSASFYRGYGWDREIGKRIKAAAGVPGVVTSTAVTEALHALDAKRIYMVTPYTEEINRAELKFFLDNGIDVKAFTHFECALSKEISNIFPKQIIERVLSVRGEMDGCDALLISCTGLRGADTVDFLERQLGMPVVTSNAATVWSTLRTLGLPTAGIAGGRLYETARSVATAAA